MGSVTFAIDASLKPRLKRFPWINWSEIGREAALRRIKLEELRARLATADEKELAEWSVRLGRKAKKDSLRQLRSQGLI